MSPKIVVVDGYTLNPGDISWGEFEKLGDLTVYDRSGDQVAERAADAPIVLTNKDLLSAKMINQLRDLKYIGVLATGTNIVDIQAATSRGIVVTNVPGYGGDSVSQHTFALILELTNRVGDHSQSVREGRWSECSDFSFTIQPLTELSGKTLGIIGVGAIGQRVAQIGTAFGMDVLAAHQRSESEIDIPNVEVEWSDLDELFRRSDVLTLHCPLTEETRELVNARRLELMKPSALLINTGRGPLVDENALAASLREGRLGGAAVDVLCSEPPSVGNPLIDEPRCLVTPHIAWATIEARRRLMSIAAANLQSFLDGKTQNCVNPSVLG